MDIDLELKNWQIYLKLKKKLLNMFIVRKNVFLDTVQGSQKLNVKFFKKII